MDLSRFLVQKIPEKYGNIIGAFTQGRNVYVTDKKTITEIFTEASLFLFSPEIPICGGNDADVDSVMFLRSDFLNQAAFQDMQKSYLRGEGKFADFIKKDGTSIRTGKISLL